MLQAMDQLTALYDQLVDEDMTDYQKVKAIYEGVMARTDYNNTVFHKYQGSSDWDGHQDYGWDGHQDYGWDGHQDYGWDGTSEDALLFPAQQDYR